MMTTRVWCNRCVWCNRLLRYDPMIGWVHADTGKLYVTTIGSDGVERDDHCALPKLSQKGGR